METGMEQAAGGSCYRAIDAALLVQRLSNRQRQVLEEMVEGRLNKQIAYRLGLSEKTVKMHRVRLLQALDVHSSAEAIRIAVEASFACWQPPSTGEHFISSPVALAA
jgi:DNA-binding NarL/FixJ family response regulator